MDCTRSLSATFSKAAADEDQLLQCIIPCESKSPLAYLSYQLFPPHRSGKSLSLAVPECRAAERKTQGIFVSGFANELDSGE